MQCYARFKSYQPIDPRYNFKQVVLHVRFKYQSISELIHCSIRFFRNDTANLQYGQSQLNKSKKSLDFYYHSIKVRTQETHNLHKLKTPFQTQIYLVKVPIKVNIVKQNLSLLQYKVNFKVLGIQTFDTGAFINYVCTF